MVFSLTDGLILFGGGIVIAVVPLVIAPRIDGWLDRRRERRHAALLRAERLVTPALQHERLTDAELERMRRAAGKSIAAHWDTDIKRRDRGAN